MQDLEAVFPLDLLVAHHCDKGRSLFGSPLSGVLPEQTSNLWLDLPLICLVLSIFSHPLNSSAPISGMYVSFGQLSLHIYDGY